MHNQPDKEHVTGVMIASGAGLVGLLALLMLGFLMLFLTEVFTLVALFAWKKPRLIGRFVIEPDDARWFVYRGMIGAGSAVIIVAVIQLLANGQLTGGRWDGLAVFGYMVGALLWPGLVAGFDAWVAEGIAPGSTAQAAPVEQVQLPALIPSETRRSLPQQSAEPFRFASWDDEEELR